MSSGNDSAKLSDRKWVVLIAVAAGAVAPRLRGPTAMPVVHRHGIYVAQGKVDGHVKVALIGHNVKPGTPIYGFDRNADPDLA